MSGNIRIPCVGHFVFLQAKKSPLEVENILNEGLLYALFL